MNLRGRINRPAAAARRQGLFPEAGCPACQDRRKVSVFVRGRKDDGDVVWDGEVPSPCAVCGEVPEEVIEIVEQIVPARGQRHEDHAG
jgi:hypothetical protein